MTGIFTMKGGTGGRSLEKVHSLENKQCSRVFWSPMGGNAVLSNFDNIAGHLEFWNVDENLSMATAEHFMCNVVEWDPSGRQVCTAVCMPIGQGSLRYDMECGYQIRTFQGTMVKKEQMKEFYQVLWRPRPPMLLTPKEVAQVRKDLPKYIKQFDDEDRKKEEAELMAIRRDKARKLVLFFLAQRKKEAVVESWERDRVAKDIEGVNEDDYDVHYEEVEEVVSTSVDYV